MQTKPSTDLAVVQALVKESRDSLPSTADGHDPYCVSADRAIFEFNRNKRGKEVSSTGDRRLDFQRDRNTAIAAFAETARQAGLRARRLPAMSRIRLSVIENTARAASSSSRTSPV